MQIRSSAGVRSADLIRLAIDDTVHGERRAIAAGAAANAIDAQQSRVARMTDARDGAKRNLTRLSPLPFMSIDVIAIGVA